ncbi:MAG: hypothetical protein WAN11_09765, partial [Syntrophobacteraceae bacterium]
MGDAKARLLLRSSVHLLLSHSPVYPFAFPPAFFPLLVAASIAASIAASGCRFARPNLFEVEYSLIKDNRRFLGFGFSLFTVHCSLLI